MSWPPPLPPAPTRPPVVPARRPNALAVASLCCSVASCVGVVTWVLGIIFGHIALSQIKRDPTQTGRGLALAGVIIGWAFGALLLVGMVLLVTVD